MINLPKERSAGSSKRLLLSGILFFAKPLGRLPVGYKCLALSSSYFQQLAFGSGYALHCDSLNFREFGSFSVPLVLHHLISVDELAFWYCEIHGGKG